MKRTIDVDIEVTTKNINTALNKFFKKYPSLIYWKENFEYMYENNQDFFCDDKLADGTKNNKWCYALHLDINENSIYMAVIERA
jgi:hypothetical protein